MPAGLTRVPPEVEPFSRCVAFAVIGPQVFIVHWRGSCGLVVFRGSGCRSRSAAARAQLRGCGLSRVRDRWGIGRAWVCEGA